MRAIVTGQIGMDKKPYLKAVGDLAGQTGEQGGCPIYNIGDMMYAEGKDVRPGRILDLPISRLNSLSGACGVWARTPSPSASPSRTSS